MQHKYKHGQYQTIRTQNDQDPKRSGPKTIRTQNDQDPKQIYPWYENDKS